MQGDRNDRKVTEIGMNRTKKWKRQIDRKTEKQTVEDI